MQYGFIDQLLGFMALSAGPLALLVIVVMGCVAISLLTRGMKTAWKKGVAGLIVASIVLLILTWDVIAGRAHFNRLCIAESGIRINKQMTLDLEYRDVQFPNTPYLYEQMPIAKRYPYNLESSDKIPGPGTIKFVRYIVRDAETGEILGTFTKYFWGGGWFENTFSLQGAGGGGCGYENGGFRSLLEQIFRASH